MRLNPNAVLQAGQALTRQDQPTRVMQGTCVALTNGIATVKLNAQDVVDIPAAGLNLYPGSKVWVVWEGPHKAFALPGPQGPARVLLTRTTTTSIGTGGGGTVIPIGTSSNLLSQVGGTFYESGTDTISIPVAGDYQVTFQGEFDANATGTRLIWALIAGNSAYASELDKVANTSAAGGTTPDRKTASGIVRLDADATLSFRAYQNSGGAINFGEVRISVVRIGPIE